jgi:hypothetical protein
MDVEDRWGSWDERYRRIDAVRDLGFANASEGNLLLIGRVPAQNDLFLTLASAYGRGIKDGTVFCKLSEKLRAIHALSA